MAIRPRRPRKLMRMGEKTRITVEKAQAMATPTHTERRGGLCADRITAEMALGPAMSGIAIGKMKGSASISSSSILFLGKSIPRAMTKSTIPPEMLRE